MNRFFLSLLSVFFCSLLAAQETPYKVTSKLYGFVRAEAALDTRRNASAFEGLFLLYPLDKAPDAAGADLNAVGSAGFYTFVSRLGVDMSGLKVFNADVTGKLEGDFAGFSGAAPVQGLLRLRQAYLRMDWRKSSLTVGQAWHPVFLPVLPDVISISTGAPFNPFARSPQLRYDYRAGKFTLTGAAIYQHQYVSPGPNGKSTLYQQQAVIPELFAGVDFTSASFRAGVGADYLTLRPRTRSVVDDGTDEFVYKVSERLGSLSWMAYLKYTGGLFSATAKTLYGRNMAGSTMVGGYGISRIDDATGRQHYTNFRHTTTWVSLAYGKKYRGSLFGGYTKNLGTEDALVEGAALYGTGLDLDHLYRVCATFTYNIPHFSLGVEYEMTTAAYGDADTFDYRKGTWGRSHDVTNHRVVGVIMYLF